MFPPSAEERDLAHCRALLRTGSRTFHAASLALPRRVRAPASALYAFCRVADDAVDQPGEGGGGLAAVRRLERRLDRIYAGEPADSPVDRAVAHVVGRFEMPRELPAALIEGLRWDTEGRVYDTLSEVHSYAARVAGSVGAMMAVLMGVRDPAGLARAADLGVAMQLSNIARDVGEDARLGRLYLPRDWLREEGIDPDDFLAAPRFDDRIGRVVARLLAVAEAHYARGAAGIAALPGDCRYAIRLAGLLYAEIGREVGRRGGDSLSARAVVGARRKLALALAALAPPGRELAGAPALAETRFLVEAAARGLDDEPTLAGAEARIAWLVDLFTRLALRERGLAGMD